MPLHEVTEIEDVVHHIWILLDDVSERLGIDQRHGKLLVKRVVVPIHFREPDDSGTGLMPAARATETTNQDRRWRRLEPAFLVNVVARVGNMDALSAALCPQ